jgi:hypothetical protein
VKNPSRLIIENSKMKKNKSFQLWIIDKEYCSPVGSNTTGSVAHQEYCSIGAILLGTIFPDAIRPDEIRPDTICPDEIRPDAIRPGAILPRSVLLPIFYS